MKVSIMQPNLFMWPGLLKSIVDSDIHIILDNVKASKNSRYNRNSIKGRGKVSWLTLPYENFSRSLEIKELQCRTSSDICTSLVQDFTSRYQDALFFSQTRDILNSTLSLDQDISPLLKVYERFLDCLKRYGLPLCECVRASDLLKSERSPESLNSIERVNLLLRYTEADTYLTAKNTRNYAQREDYKINQVLIQDFCPVEYAQTAGEGGLSQGFTANLSCLDALSFMDISDMLSYMDESNAWIEYND